MPPATNGGLVHAIAWCETCGWEAPSWKNAMPIAAKHAQSKHHLVRVETGFAWTFDGRA